METETRVCRKCGEPKSIDDFTAVKTHPITGVVYRRRICKACFVGELVWANRRKKYGITQEQYKALLAKQNGGCAICGRAETENRKRQLCVDHCHETGRIRGLLCNRHNAALGYFGDDLPGLTRVVEYLRRAEGRSDGDAPTTF
jgi:hypothetical protein